MPKISNQSKYPEQEIVNKKDYVIGTDYYDKKKTKTFPIQNLAQVLADILIEDGGIEINVGKTSQLINDGEFGDSRFVEENELTQIIQEILSSLDKYELTENKQNNLNPDGTGIKFPTVDAVIQAVYEINLKLSNKSDVDGANSVGNLKDSIDKRHSHPHQAVIDNITAQDITNWNNSIGQSHNPLSLGLNTVGLSLNASAQILQLTPGYSIPTNVDITKWNNLSNSIGNYALRDASNLLNITNWRTVLDLYSKPQVDNLLNLKQDKLTTGANIQISPTNVISATDTTYSQGSGISIIGGVITNTAQNVTQVLGLSGQSLSLSNGGGSVVLPFTDWSNITNKPNTFAPSAHTHTSNEVTSLTGYTLGTNNALSATDSLNTALGKLEAQVNSKTSNTGTVTSVTAGSGLAGGVITTSGIISLSAATLASLLLANSSLQPGDPISLLNNDVPYATESWVNSQGYLTSFTETDPTVPSHVKGISTTDIAYWNAKLNASALNGYATELWANNRFVQLTDPRINDWNDAFALSHSHANKNILDTILNKNISQWTNDSGYITSAGLPTVGAGNITYQGVGAITGGGMSNANQTANTIFDFDLTTATKTNIALGVTANSWGNHANMGYLTNFTESDPTVPTWVKAITQANINYWNGKQNALVAGSNITINPTTNVISATDTNTITRLRGTITGTYQSGDLTLLAGNNVSIIQNGNNFTINSSYVNTTYTSSNGIQLIGNNFSPVYGTSAGTIAQGNDARFHNAVTLGTANGLNLVNQVLSLGAASASSNGALSAVDWVNFNNKFTFPSGGNSGQYLNGLGQLATFPNMLQSLSVGTLMGQLNISQGNTVYNNSIVNINKQDANSIPHGASGGLEAWSFNASGDINYPIVPGAGGGGGISYFRNGTTGLHSSFDILKMEHSEEKLRFRVGTGTTTKGDWKIFASEEWVLNEALGDFAKRDGSNIINIPQWRTNLGVYSTTQVDSLLAGKANTSGYYSGLSVGNADNANNSTRWNGQEADWTPNSGTWLESLMGLDNNTGKASIYTPTQVSNWLGINTSWNLQQVTDNGASTTHTISVGGVTTLSHGTSADWNAKVSQSDLTTALNTKVTSWQNAIGLGFNNNSHLDLPYVLHSNSTVVNLATETWVNNNFASNTALGNYVNKAGDIMSGVLSMQNPSGDSYINYASSGKIANIGYNGNLAGLGFGGIFNVINGSPLTILTDAGHLAIGYGIYNSPHMLDVNGEGRFAGNLFIPNAIAPNHAVAFGQLANYALTNGSNTIGGAWDISAIYSSLLNSQIGNGQIFNQNGNQIYWGNPSLAQHTFEATNANSMRVYSSSTTSYGIVYNSLNLTNVSQLVNDAGYVTSLSNDFVKNTLNNNDANVVSNTIWTHSNLNLPAWFPVDQSGTLLHKEYNSSFSTQLAMSYYGGLAYRHKSYGSFSSWYKIYSTLDFDIANYALLSQVPTNNNQLANGANYTTLPIVQSWVGSQGYLTSFTETDPTVPSHVKAITTTNITNWNAAFGWGNHAGLYPLLSGSYANPTWITSIDWSKITNAPTIPTVGNGQLSFTAPTGLSITGTFNANQSGNTVIPLTWQAGYQGFTTAEATKLAGIQAGATVPNNGTFTVQGTGALTGNGSTSANALANTSATLDLTTATKNDIKQGTEAKNQLTSLFSDAMEYFRYHDMSGGGFVDTTEAFFNLVNPKTVSGLAIDISDHTINGARLVLQGVTGMGGIVTYKGRFIMRNHVNLGTLTVEGQIDQEFVWDANVSRWREVF